MTRCCPRCKPSLTRLRPPRPQHGVKGITLLRVTITAQCLQNAGGTDVDGHSNVSGGVPPAPAAGCGTQNLAAPPPPCAHMPLRSCPQPAALATRLTALPSTSRHLNP